MFSRLSQVGPELYQGFNRLTRFLASALTKLSPLATRLESVFDNDRFVAQQRL